MSSSEVLGVSDRPVPMDTDEEDFRHLRPSEEAQNAIASIEVPDEDGRLDPRRVSPFPNLAGESMKAMVSYEAVQTKKLGEYGAIIDTHLDNIDELLTLNSELAKIPDKDAQEFSKELKELFAKLKEKGFDFGNIDKKISKDRKGEIKSLINSFIDRNRTRMNTVQTKIQYTTTNTTSVIDIMRRILTLMEKLAERISSNTAKG